MNCAAIVVVSCRRSSKSVATSRGSAAAIAQLLTAPARQLCRGIGLNTVVVLALDDLDDLFGEEDEVSEEDKAASRLKAKQDCLKLHADYKEAVDSITPGVRVYRSIETSVAAVIHTVDHYSKHILILMLLIA